MPIHTLKNPVRNHHLILTHRVWPQLFVEPFKSPSADPWQPLVEASLLVAKGWDVLDQKILPLTLPPSPSLPIPLPTPFSTHPRTAAKTTHIHALTSASYIARNILVVLFLTKFNLYLNTLFTKKVKICFYNFLLLTKLYIFHISPSTRLSKNASQQQYQMNCAHTGFFTQIFTAG